MRVDWFVGRWTTVAVAKCSRRLELDTHLHHHQSTPPTDQEVPVRILMSVYLHADHKSLFIYILYVYIYRSLVPVTQA